MSENHFEIMKNLTKNHEFFIGIDSDGCVFDSMEVKQKECFCPNFIKHWDLQLVSKYARETWEFVNLYSKTRGCNRFLGVVHTFALLAERPEVLARGIKLHDISPLIEWTEKESKLGEPVLAQYAPQVNNPIIDKALAWSQAVNASVKDMVFGLGPFAKVKDCLEKMSPFADVIVVSQTPLEALKREWEENDMAKYVELICGQEYGKKSEHLQYCAKGKYDDDKILMVGDAPGDLQAAQDNGVCYYPINPGHEDESWERFYSEALDKFFNGTYKGDYENKCIEQFNSYLPQTPPWKK